MKKKTILLIFPILGACAHPHYETSKERDHRRFVEDLMNVGYDSTTAEMLADSTEYEIEQVIQAKKKGH